MKVVDRHLQLALAAEANRAPSLHNTQPARWRFGREGVVELFEATDRRPPVADPAGRDTLISLGATFEGLHLALTARGMALEAPQLMETSVAGVPRGLRIVARSAIVEGAAQDPLRAEVPNRRTFRGRFVDPDANGRDGLRQALAGSEDVIVLLQPGEIASMARLNDVCSLEFLRCPEYQRELYEWMRLSSRHPGWHRDGLNADCLALSAVERRLAALLFRPPVFRCLGSVALDRVLISERSRTASATGIVIVTADQAQHPLATGRRFYRLWLAITRAGFALCPMSSLGDSPRGAALLRARHGIGPARAIVNVFRVGRPPGAVPASARLPAGELLV
jgi:hypothetical protein